MIQRREPRGRPVVAILGLIVGLFGCDLADAFPAESPQSTSATMGEQAGAMKPAEPFLPTNVEIEPSLLVGDSAAAEVLIELATSQDPSRRQPQTPTRPQPTPSTTPPARPIPPRTTAAPTQSSRFYRLASVPEMFGDFFGGGTITAVSTVPFGTVMATLPTAGGARRFKVAENNRPLPQDRCFFTYNHFHNAVESEVTGLFLGASPAPDDFSVDRYTIGMERTFCEGQWSAELRVPFTGRFAEAAAGFEVDGGKWGNLSLVLKRLLCSSETSAVAAGVAIDFPTGSDVDGTIGTDSFSLDNDAYHLMPYLGFMSLPDDRTFVQGFFQLDVPLNGNRVEVGPAGGSGRLDEQVLMFFDIAAGYWVYRNDCDSGLTGLAPIAELHYTTTLKDTDSVAFATGVATYDFANAANRLDVLNLTLGLHAQFGSGLNVRVGAVFPLRHDDDKLFDAELQVSVNWRY